MLTTSIRLPEPLVREIDDLAARSTRTRSQQLVHLIRVGIVAIGRPDPLGSEPIPDDRPAADEVAA